MTDDIKKLVDEWLPGFIPSSDLERFAAAVREAVLKRVRVCDGCGGDGSVFGDSRQRTINQCERCHGRGVVEGET